MLLQSFPPSSMVSRLSAHLSNFKKTCGRPIFNHIFADYNPMLFYPFPFPSAAELANFYQLRYQFCPIYCSEKLRSGKN